MKNAITGKMLFHEHKDILFTASTGLGQSLFKKDTEFTYIFENFFHPFVGELIEELNKKSLHGMLDPKFHQNLIERFGEFFNKYYETPENSADIKKNYKNSEKLVKVIPPKKTIDLNPEDPYANYNWELLFHIPLTIAVHLSKNQRFAEAQRWFHYIFDPTSNDTLDPIPKHFWKFLTFRQDRNATRVDELLVTLSKLESESTLSEIILKQKILNGYDAIGNNPFQPHAVARTRYIAYQYYVVMKYLDNLIAWGDNLFRQDTIESINEATQRYVLAANLLGARPQRIPQRGISRPKTFAELKSRLDPMSNAQVDLETAFPFNLGLPQQSKNSEAFEPLFGIGRTLYFCIPHNEKILDYWDIVADRLFKIRNCMNIEGIVRQLSLFDSGPLAKAAAAGIIVSSSGLNQPISPVRSLLLIQKALELCTEVRSLGSALLSAIEKNDGEHIALLRQNHEIKIQQIAQDVRFLQWKQAQESTESLLRSRSTVIERYRYYQRLLGLTPDTQTTPDKLPLDRRELTEENFEEAYAALVGEYEKVIEMQAYSKLKIEGDTSPLNQSGVSDNGNLYLNANESLDLNILSPISFDLRAKAGAYSTVFGILAMLPLFKIEAAYWGVGGSTETVGGQVFSGAGQIISSGLNTEATLVDSISARVSKTASYERRADDWMLQCNLAAHELVHLGRQLIGSLIAEQIARREYLNIQKQIEYSQEVDRFLHEKFTSEELYSWMQGEISRLYYEYYNLAFDTAQKAEQAMKHELMRPEVDSIDFVKFNHWDAGRKGLLSGEMLYLDVKCMETAYFENNKREYELTKHISLRQLNPLALLALKAKAACEVTLPEWLFDLECPGHYMRRIKSVSMSIPSVTGPYTSVSCTLSLLKSSLRKSPLLKESKYARQLGEDDRFVDYFGTTIQSIVTSSGNNDSGMFETNLRDERFLPFEGSGVESTWKLELPADFHQFDYDTISDVIFHIKYTARLGDLQLRNKAVENLKEIVGEADNYGLFLLFNLKHDFPNEWHQFVVGNADFKVTVKRDYFPYLTQGKKITIRAIELCTIKAETSPIVICKEPNRTDWSDKLNGESAFELSLVNIDINIVKEQKAQVFAVIKYSIG